jgi:PAS domain S-box-containing protein
LKPTFNRTRTIRAWFALLVIACILPAAIAATLLITHSYQRERARVERSTIETARALMQAVDRELSSAQGALQALATSPYLLSGDLLAFYVQAGEVLRRMPGNNLVLIDATGQQLINTLQPMGAPLPRHANLAQVRRVFQTARPVISDLHFGAISRRAMITIDVPVMQGDRVAYDLAMGFLPDRLAEILKQERLPSDWPIAIFDSAGVTVARTREPERFIGQKGIPRLVQRMTEAGEDSFEAVTPEGIPVIVAFSRSSVSNWAVAIGVPRATLTRELWESVSWIVAGSLLLLMTGLVLAKTIGDRITRSVRGLAAPAMALGYGDPVVVPELHLTEANEVGQALGKASELLRERTSERDQAEKTAQDIRLVQQKLERSEALQRGIFEEASDALLLVAPAGSIVRANAEAERVFGYTREELRGLIVEELMPQGSRCRHMAHRQAFFAAPLRRAMGSSGMLLRGRRADGSEFPVDVMLSPLHSDGGDLVIASVRDVTERRRNEEALRASEKRFRSTLEHAPIGMSIVSPEGRWLDVNSAMCELVGYTKPELQNLTTQEITHPDDVEKDLAYAKQLLNGEIRSYQLEKRYIRKDGSTVTVLLTRSLLRDDNGKPVHFIAQIEDISARTRAQEQLTILNDRLALATQAGGLGVWELDLRSQVMWWDERMYELYKISPDAPGDIREKWRKHVLPDQLARLERELDEAIRGDGTFATEFPIVWPDGQVRTIRTNAVLTRDNAGQPLRVTGVNWDVTQSRQKEDAIGAALQEKETLLKELYHRVKNNLQVIISLFNLQVRTLPEGLARIALQEGADRVRAMALVHEKLYQSKSLSSIALDEYITDLCRQLGNAAGAQQRAIELVTDAEPVEVSVETAVPLGLLLNELISNGLQHAFPDGRCGSIVVHLERKTHGAMLLTVSDNGVGLPTELDPTFPHTLGLKLVNALTAQLDGHFRMQNRQGGQGTCASITFRLPDRVQAVDAKRRFAAAP